MKEIKWGRFTESQIKERLPKLSEIMGRIDKNIPVNRKYLYNIHINVLQYIVAKIFYAPDTRLSSKDDLIDIILNRDKRNKLLDIFHPKNEKYTDRTILKTDNIAEVVNLKKTSLRTITGRPKKQAIEVKNNIPVRRCGKECIYRQKCVYYRDKKVTDGDMCIEDIGRVEKWIDAFKNKNPEQLTENAGMLCGILELQLIDMTHQIRNDGVMLELTKTDNFGNPIYDKNTGEIIREKTPHPLLKDVARIMQTMKINLPEYLMSPKSKGEQTIMEGNIKDNKKIDIKVALKEQKDAYSKLESAITKASETRKRIDTERKNKKNEAIDKIDEFSKEDIDSLPSALRNMLVYDDGET